MSLSPNTRLGRYEIRAHLGAGGMGEVYLAHDTRLERTVALKILPSEVASDQKRMQRFVQEAKAASALNHPNIITIHEIEQSDSTHFIATEFIDGETLRERMARAALSIPEALDVALQVATALAAAHAAGIVHRDIKPENIMIRRDSFVKVLDFGLAKLTERPRAAAAIDKEAPTRALVNTEPGVVMGTAHYMSPEQARGLEVDARTDIWSLGCVLYEMVAGQRPFNGETTTDVIAAIIKTPLVPLTRLAQEAPVKLEEITTKALEKDREERYQGVRDLLVDLRRLKKRLEFEAEMERSVSPDISSAPTVIIDSSQAAFETESKIEPPATADTIQAARQTSSAEYVFNGIKRHRLAALIALLVVICAAIGLGFYLHARNKEAAIDSIAVLPFVNENHDPEAEYLSDGLTESIINSLTQLPSLRVIARSSVFRYKGKETDPMAVGQELDVRAVMTGRLLQRGDSLIVSAELLDVRDNKQIWGEQYSRKVSDALAVQHEISREISERLRLKLTGEEQRQMARRETSDPEAYQLYLKGLYYTNKFTKEGYQKGLDYFNQAIDKDPTFALAYAGIAHSYQISADWYRSQHEAIPKAREAAQKALALDDTLAEAHLKLAWIEWTYDWNWSGAEQEFRRAIELKPTDAETHGSYGEFLTALKRFDEARTQMARAQELDPLSSVMAARSGLPYYFARQYDKSLEHFRQAVDLDANFWYAQYFLGLAEEQTGAFAAAATAFQQAERVSDAPEVAAALGHLYAIAGKRDEALKALDQLKNESKERYVSPYDTALIDTALGDKEQAFADLQKAYDDRTAWIAMYLNIDPRLDSLRSDQRFAELVRRIGL